MTLILEKRLAKWYEVRGGQLERYEVAIDKRYREHLNDLLKTHDAVVAGNFVKSLHGGYMVLRRSSRRLGRIFGDREHEVHKTLDHLVDETMLLTLEAEELEQYVLEAETVLRARAERVGVEFANLTLLEARDRNWVMAQVLGWARLMEHSEAQLLDQRRNAIEGTVEMLYDFRGLRILIANCGTGKPEMMPVDKNCKDCEAAQAWLAGDTVPGLQLPRFFSLGRT